jgi:hypothetical protein
MKRTMGRIAVAAVVIAVATVDAATATAQSSAVRRASAKPATKPVDAGDLTLGLTLGAYALAAGGVQVTGPDIDGDFSTNLGEGLGVTVGYGFNRIFSAFASLDLVKQATAPGIYPGGTYGLAHFEVGGRANIPIGSPKAVPYVSASVGRRALAARVTDEDTGQQFDDGMSGTMYAFGGGMQYFLSPRLALDGGVELGMGSFDHAKGLDGDHPIQVNSSSTSRLRFGVNWHP